ncbi:hypothetical protein EHP00_2576 [Ecytonucleospora hepatopenaei]|nr:hypothetical protein EHP00_2576 [Ecytonucleospora hepatopenaei]
MIDKKFDIHNFKKFKNLQNRTAVMNSVCNFYMTLLTKILRFLKTKQLNKKARLISFLNIQISETKRSLNAINSAMLKCTAIFYSFKFKGQEIFKTTNFTNPKRIFQEKNLENIFLDGTLPDNFSENIFGVESIYFNNLLDICSKTYDDSFKTFSKIHTAIKNRKTSVYTAVMLQQTKLKEENKKTVEFYNNYFDYVCNLISNLEGTKFFYEILWKCTLNTVTRLKFEKNHIKCFYLKLCEQREILVNLMDNIETSTDYEKAFHLRSKIDDLTKHMENEYSFNKK